MTDHPNNTSKTSPVPFRGVGRVNLPAGSSPPLANASLLTGSVLTGDALWLKSIL